MAQAGESLQEDETDADVCVLVVDDDVVADVFEPGFSTRHDGTGFGLAIVADVAESHGWEASVGETEQGARIEIQF